jgi:thiol-disulfide isomerase/thioredoxin
LTNYLRFRDPDRLRAIGDRFEKRAQARPDDPLALYLEGIALFQVNTVESLQLLEKAKSMAPHFPAALLALAYFHSYGKHADKKALGENISAYFNECPASTDELAHLAATKANDKTLQTNMASALRARLERQKDPKKLEQYSRLWGLEFRVHPPQEHVIVRKQVAQDLKRIEPLNRRPDADWLAFLIKGYKQSDAPPETITALEDRLLHEFPRSDEAYRIVWERWSKAHKEPEDPKNTAEWTQYQETYTQAVEGWVRDYPDNQEIQVYGWFETIESDDSLTEQQGLAALDRFLKTSARFSEPNAGTYESAAAFLVQHKWQAERALALMGQADEAYAKARRLESENDNASAEDELFSGRQGTFQTDSLFRTRLRAAKLAMKPESAASVRASVEGPEPEDKKFQSMYWRNRGLLAELDGRKADALTFYQFALQTRTGQPQWWRGKLHDDLTDEARALWHELGGSESAWQVWSKPPSDKAKELTEGRWEKPTKELPLFELADMTGKKWVLKQQEGKSVLINIWATWCGPCQMELPELQKLYDSVKERKDIQILTLNFDDDLGLVAPFLKEKGYTFPVLPAYEFVSSTLEGIGIPQNWIIDPRGTWKWTQLGFGAESDWQASMIQKLESVRAER